MSERNPLPERLRVAHLSPNRPNPFDLQPAEDRLQALAGQLDLTALPALRFTGEVRASGSDEWALDGRLTARVVQPCVITLEPVETDITEDVSLIFSPHVTDPEEEEVEMGDETVEPLGQSIMLGEIAIEALTLALPVNPRAPGAEMPAPAEEVDMTGDEGRKPFAGLADLLKKDG